MIQRQRLFATVFSRSYTEDAPAFGVLGGPTSNNGATAAAGPGRNQSISANLTHVFSPNLITEFRLGYVRVHITAGVPSEENLGNTLGIPGTNTGDFFTSTGIPRITLTSTYSFLGAAAGALQISPEMPRSIAAANAAATITPDKTV